MDMLEKFQTYWRRRFRHLSPGNCQLLLAVSGGVDSVVMVDLVTKAGFEVSIAHANFQLRGEESERDEIFVRSLAEKYAKEILVKRFDTREYSVKHKVSIQEAARELRYAWFREIVDSRKSRVEKEEKSINRLHCILTAHHADDNIETMLMHFFRGTGIQGLTGIQTMQEDGVLLRPMLHFKKQELADYADANGLNYVEDSSNASDKDTRNFFRNSLLPQIREVFPQVDDNLLHNIDRFTETAELYRQSVASHLKKLGEPKGSEVHIPVLKWKKVTPLHTITWELIKTYGFTAAQTQEVIKLLDADNASYITSSTHRIIRNRSWMIISPHATDTAQHIVVEKGDKKIVFEKGSLQIRETKNQQTEITDHSSEAFLDVDEIHYPLLLRKWKQGDYFYPLGMQKKKKLRRFLIDQKLSKTEKEKVWVLESNKKIIWVIGYRIDNRVRITPHTKNLLQISYRK